MNKGIDENDIVALLVPFKYKKRKQYFLLLYIFVNYNQEIVL